MNPNVRRLASYNFPKMLGSFPVGSHTYFLFLFFSCWYNIPLKFYETVVRLRWVSDLAKHEQFKFFEMSLFALRISLLIKKTHHEYLLLYVGIFQRPPLNPCCLRMIPLPAFVTLAYFLCRFILTEKKTLWRHLWSAQR